LKLSEENPEEETSMFRPAELPHHHFGGGTYAYFRTEGM